MYVFPVLLASVLLATSANGKESTNATCIQDPWTTNSEGLSPCNLSVILEGACFNGNFELPILPSGSEYNGPPPDTSNTCQCSSVTYSVVQACAACQGGSITPWQMWIQNCIPSQVGIQSYPLPIPNVTVPAWAFIDVSVDGVFEPAKASALATQPESSLTGPPQPTSTTGSTTSTTTNGSTSHASGAKSSSHTGAIVGGVIGGLVGAALIGIGAFIVYRRQRKFRKNQPRMLQEKVDMTQPNHNYTDTYSLSPPKLYDPSDPSTFPRSPAPTFTNSLLTSTTSPPPTSPGHRPGNSSGSYSGFPEL